MEWQIVVVLSVAIPIVLVPAAFIWFLNISGLYQVIKDRIRRRNSLRVITIS
jgi:hypothetical protein